MFSLTSLSFQRPGLFFLMVFSLLIAALYLYGYLAREKQKELLDFPDLLNDRLSSYYILRTAFLCIAWIALCNALAGPRGNPEYLFPTKVESQTKENVVFVIDTSYSMSAGDVTAAKSRLEYASDLTDELLKAKAGATVSVYALSSQLQKIVPFSKDSLFARLVVRGLVPDEGAIPGTDFYRSLSMLKEEVGEKQIQLYILSDGGDTEINDDPAARAAEVAEALKELRGEIIFVGIGSEKQVQLKEITYQDKPVYSKLEKEFLKALAKESQSQLVFQGNKDALTLSKELSGIAEQSRGVIASDLIYKEYFRLPLLIAIFFLFAALFVPEVKR